MEGEGEVVDEGGGGVGGGGGGGGEAVGEVLDIGARVDVKMPGMEGEEVVGELIGDEVGGAEEGKRMVVVGGSRRRRVVVVIRGGQGGERGEFVCIEEVGVDIEAQLSGKGEYGERAWLGDGLCCCFGWA